MSQGGLKTMTNRKIAVLCCCMVLFMAGLAYAAVPLYDLFCRVTGYGGTTQVAQAAPVDVKDITVTVRFDANVNNGLNWEFEPVDQQITVKLGEVVETAYRAKNLSEEDSVGTSTFNVTPVQTGGYFNKMACFCFTEQPLKAGEETIMPVVFFVDPAILDDPDARDIRNITLSYTMFPAKSAKQSAKTALYRSE
jgi:cytochrome c oxidase assembly protein subunit 11